MEPFQIELTITEKDLISRTQLMAIEVKHSRVYSFLDGKHGKI